ncbi:MAG: hypothetical protein LBB14_01895 [Puniceicoccales bacterium]|nr:hypothetical protein [Puniceicoccales bacterium]
MERPVTLFALGNRHPEPLPPGTVRGQFLREAFAGGNCDVAVRGQEPAGRALLWATKDLETSPGQRFLELALAAEALLDFFGGAPDLLLPYCDGCRSHRPSTVRALARSLAALPVRSIVFFDLHREDILDLLPQKAVHLPTLPLWAQFAEKLSPPVDWVVAPDLGRARAAADLAKLLSAGTIALDKGRPEEPLPPEVNGRHVLLFDDEIVSGRTLQCALGRLGRAGVKSVAIAVSYALCPATALATLAGEPSVRALAVGDLIARPAPPCGTVPLAIPLLERFLAIGDEQRAGGIAGTGAANGLL